jgi:hypothetical protein
MRPDSGVGLPLRYHDLRRTPSPGLQQRKGSQLMSRATMRNMPRPPAASALFTGHAGADGGYLP